MLSVRKVKRKWSVSQWCHSINIFYDISISFIAHLMHQCISLLSHHTHLIRFHIALYIANVSVVHSVHSCSIMSVHEKMCRSIDLWSATQAAKMFSYTKHNGVLSHFLWIYAQPKISIAPCFLCFSVRSILSYNCSTHWPNDMFNIKEYVRLLSQIKSCYDLSVMFIASSSARYSHTKETLTTTKLLYAHSLYNMSHPFTLYLFYNCRQTIFQL